MTFMKLLDKEIASIGVGTRAVWGGENQTHPYNATQVPIACSVAYGYDDLDEWHQIALGEQPGYIYTRNANPTVSVFEEKVRVLEGADAALALASGMGAIANSLYTFLRPGDRVVSVKDTYGGATSLFLNDIPQMGIDVTLCDTDDYQQIEAEVAKGCDVLYLETPTNPTMKIIDISRLAKAGKATGAIVIVDNTFSTPILQNPLALGVDLVLHSATKFLGGHADAMGGVVCGSKELIKKVRHYRDIHGATLDAFSAYLLIRGMKTLKLRVEKQSSNALALAQYLQKHSLLEVVNYPGLPTHKNHDIAKKQMRAFGAVLSFALKGDIDAAKIMLPRLRIAHRAANLGAVETICGLARTTSHVECTPEERKAMGIPEGLVRVSVGIEDIEDIIADFEQALNFLEAKKVL